jgi:cell division protein FtsZ
MEQVEINRIIDIPLLHRGVILVGGGAIASSVRLTEGAPALKFTGIDCDPVALETQAMPDRLIVGSESCHGNMAYAREIATASLDKILDKFARIDILHLVVALGGGFGCGASPIIAEAARSIGVEVIMSATLPFRFEGRERAVRAHNALVKLLSLSKHEAVIELDGILPLMPLDARGPEDFFTHADRFLASATLSTLTKS